MDSTVYKSIGSLAFQITLLLDHQNGMYSIQIYNIITICRTCVFIITLKPSKSAICVNNIFSISYQTILIIALQSPLIEQDFLQKKRISKMKQLIESLNSSVVVLD